MTSRVLDIGGLMVRWEEQGMGRPIILLHGIPTGPALWRKVIPLLEGYRRLAFELPGYGGSIAQGMDIDLSLGAQATYCRKWMDRLGIDRALLVGHGVGGGLAQLLAARHPDRVEGLVLVDSVAYDAWPNRVFSAIARSGVLIERMPDAGVRELLRTLFRRGHAGPELAREALSVHWPYYGKAPEGAGTALVRQARSLAPTDIEAVVQALPMLGLPTLVVWGAADKFQKLSSGKRLAADLSAPLDRIPGARHFVPEDNPERVASAISWLLQEILRRSGLREVGSIAP